MQKVRRLFSTRNRPLTVCLVDYTASLTVVLLGIWLERTALAALGVSTTPIQYDSLVATMSVVCLMNAAFGLGAAINLRYSTDVNMVRSAARTWSITILASLGGSIVSWAALAYATEQWSLVALFDAVVVTSPLFAPLGYRLLGFVALPLEDNAASPATITA